MLKSFRHKGLREFYATGSTADILPHHKAQLIDILRALNHARSPMDMMLPGFKTHALKGKLKSWTASSVSGPWRVIYQFDKNGDAINIDYVQYH